MPTALHVGDEIGFDAELLGKMVQRFDTAKGSHLCVLGTGRTLVEEANLLKMIALHLVHQGFPYVSIAVGGFKACIPHIKAGKMEYVKTAGRTKKRAADEVAAPTQLSCLPPTAPMPEKAGGATVVLPRKSESESLKASTASTVVKVSSTTAASNKPGDFSV